MAELRRVMTFLAILLTVHGVAQAFGSAPQSSAAAAEKASLTTRIKIDGTATGLVFGGVGAISGGGGNSRLLIDYQPKQRDEILDYLFKPGYGAALQVLKLEIGGDANSTDGSEPSVEHTSGVVNCDAGYEFWLAEQAKRRNPDIKLYGLAWAAPGWIDHHDFWSQETVDYLMTWMDCAHSHGLKIDYLGGWNERGFKEPWYENLRAALTKRHSSTQIVGDDSGWRVASAMVKDPAFASSIDIVGVHYSCEGGDGGSADACHSTKEGLETKKPLWDSESGSQDDNSGAGPLIRAIVRGYVDAQMTGFLNWPLLAAITSNLPYPTTGLMVAGQPWSGHYSLGKSLWVTAQVTQFSQPGWIFLRDASGYLGDDRLNGSYATLRSPDGADYSLIVETTSADSPSKVAFRANGNLSKKVVHVWATEVAGTSHSNEFVHVSDLNPDSSGTYQFDLHPGYVYTFSTLAGAGKGQAVAPPAGPLTLPYRESFEAYKAGQEARYASDMQGSFEVQPCVAGRAGKCLQQMAATKPIEWQNDSDAFTLLGDPSWTNYTVSVDAEFTKPGEIELIGRAGIQKRPQSHQQGYFFRVSDQGEWTLFRSNSDGKHTDLSHGSVAAPGTGSWHRLELSFRNDQIVASLDGKRVTAVTDDSYSSGQIGMGLVGYDTDQFDNLVISPLGSPQSRKVP